MAGRLFKIEDNIRNRKIIRSFKGRNPRYYKARLRIHSEVIPSERLSGIYTGQPGMVERAGSRGR